MSNIIKIWIDLWTTNSAICINKDWNYNIIKNSNHAEYTPSVFWFDKSWNKKIWQWAYDQLYKSVDNESLTNYKAEIKRLMGTNEKIIFKSIDKQLSPEEISAEILIYLKESILKKYPDFDTQGVVITVPAYFDTIQKEATKKAWELAGFNYVILLQEPIAAAIAYWFDNKKNENRLVYDLWGGTFDVAVISSKDWVLTVKWHAGDNYLWWKDFDNLIVDNIFVPKLKESYVFDNLNRNNINMLTLYNKLKGKAEECKKQLTDNEVHKFNIDCDIDLIKDEEWKEVYLEIEITRWEFESLISKLVDKSIDLCDQAIKDSGFEFQDISKVILVWWSTMSPYIRQRLEMDLKIEVDSSVDPLTVVAKGSCIFWWSQIIPQSHEMNNICKKVGSFDLELNYETMVSETDTTITWILKDLNWNEEDYYIQIQSADNNYSSSKVKLKNGKFFDNVLVSEWKTNDYYIYLTDSTWAIIPTHPDSFSIVHGLSIAWTPLSHSVSIALNKKTFLWEQNEEYCEVIFPKWSILPLKKTLTYRTTRNLKKGDPENSLPIKIYEWESKRVDRNKQICEIRVSWVEIPYNLPEWTEVNLTLEKTISDELNVSIYFPSIDLYKNGKSLRTEGEQEIISTKDMKSELEQERNRLDEISEHISDSTKIALKEDIEELYNQSDSIDLDTKMKTHHKIKELKNKLDKFEQETEWERSINQFNEEIKKSEELFNQSDFPLEYKQAQSLKEEWHDAIKSKNREKLETINDAINWLRLANVMNTIEWMQYMLSILYEKRHESLDPIKSNEIFNRSVSYIQSNNIEWMRICVRELLELFPTNIQWELNNISGISK